MCPSRGPVPFRFWPDADLLHLVEDPNPVPAPSAEALDAVRAEIRRRRELRIWSLEEEATRRRP